MFVCGVFVCVYACVCLYVMCVCMCVAMYERMNGSVAKSQNGPLTEPRLEGDLGNHVG